MTYAYISYICIYNIHISDHSTTTCGFSVSSCDILLNSLCAKRTTYKLSTADTTTCTRQQTHRKEGRQLKDYCRRRLV